MPPTLFFFLLFSLPEEIDKKNILLRFKSKSVLLMFSSRNFVVSGLICKSVIQFEFF